MTDNQYPDREPASRDEIDDELTFHLRALVDEYVAQGMPLDAAWDAAQKRFGSLTRYSNECRRATPRGYFLAGVFAGGMVVVAAIAGFAIYEAQVLQRKQHEAEAALAAARAAAERAQGADLQGSVFDAQGRPVPKADVLVVLKTWPGGWFRQDDFATKTDGQGNFQLSNLIPAEGRYAVQVAALGEGHALASHYEVVDGDGSGKLEPLELRLGEAVPITLLVRDPQGRPVPEPEVVPSTRRTRDGEEHLVYFQGSEVARVTGDAEGRVTLRCFAPGDRAEIYVRSPGADWELRAIEVRESGETIEISAAAPQVVPRAPPGELQPGSLTTSL